MAIYKSTVSNLLLQTLSTLMKSAELSHFRVGGGIGLCMHLNHRSTNEIDLYTDLPFDEAAFQKINSYLIYTFGITEHSKFPVKGKGIAFFIYNLNQDYVKVELHYNTPIIHPPVTEEDIRFVSTEDTIAMKLESIRAGGTKLDFWDLHTVMNTYSLMDMLALHEERYVDSHNSEEIIRQLQNFERANDDFQPKCLLRKNWQLIKLDFLDFARSYELAAEK